jgi:hypothetical protein
MKEEIAKIAEFEDTDESFENFRAGFLPANYEAPATTSGWLKPEAGETHKIRIMGTMSNPNQGVLCWEGWKDKKPLRQAYTAVGYDIVHEYDEKSKPKHSWIFQIYHYETQSAMIWGVSQRGLQDELRAYTLDPDWGDPRMYDMKISREGTMLDTKWRLVTGNNKSEPTPEMVETMEKAKIDVSQVFAKNGFGDNPFGALADGDSDGVPF